MSAALPTSSRLFFTPCLNFHVMHLRVMNRFDPHFMRIPTLRMTDVFALTQGVCLHLTNFILNKNKDRPRREIMKYASGRLTVLWQTQRMGYTNRAMRKDVLLEPGGLTWRTHKPIGYSRCYRRWKIILITDKCPLSEASDQLCLNVLKFIHLVAGNP